MENLSASKTEEIRKIFLRISSPFTVCRNAALALGKIGDLRAVEPLIASLGDKFGSVRFCTAASLGQLGDVRVIEPLNACLDDEEESVHNRAAEALLKIRKS